MGITVKKKKLTVKTLRAQPGESAASDESESKSGTSEIPTAKPPSAEAEIPTAAPPVAAAAPTVKPASYTLAGTLAIIAVIMFITLIVLQSLEWNFFNDAFPRPLQPGAAPAPSSYAPASPTDMETLAPQPLDALDE